MNMRFTDLTHMHLKKSIDQIHGQQQEIESDYHIGRHLPTNGSSVRSAGSREAINLKRVPQIDLAAVRQNPATAQSYSGSLSSYSQSNKLTSSSGGSSSSKFHSLLSVKDALLDEKESTIVKLRLQVSSLQHQVKDSNSSLRQVVQNQQSGVTRALNSVTLNSPSHHNGDVSHPETEYEAAKMRVRLAESLSLQENNVNDLQNLLGKTECQLAEARSQHAHEKRGLEEKVKELEFCLRARDQTITDVRRKHKSLLDRIEKYKRRVESLERYLGDLPTIEESREIKKTLDNLAAEKGSLDADVLRLRGDLESAKSELRSKKDDLVEERANIERLECEKQKLLEKITDFERQELELGETERFKFEEMKIQLDRLRKEREDAATLLFAADTKIKTLTAQHKGEIGKLKDVLEQEENSSQTLRRDLASKQQSSTKVQVAMTQLASQNQQLMEEKLSLLEQLRALENERSNSRDVSRIYARLQRETQIAARDLEAVTQVLIQSSRGDDPNLSALLGVRSSSVGLTEDEDDSGYSEDYSNSVQALTRKLTDIRKLRRDIDELRSTLSNRYAENIGQNCATQ